MSDTATTRNSGKNILGFGPSVTNSSSQKHLVSMVSTQKILLLTKYGSPNSTCSASEGPLSNDLNNKIAAVPNIHNTRTSNSSRRSVRTIFHILCHQEKDFPLVAFHVKRVAAMMQCPLMHSRVLLLQLEIP